MRSRPIAKRSRWSYTSANSARDIASARDVRVRPWMALATLCIRRYASGGSEYRARTRRGAAVCRAQGLEPPGIRDPQRSQDCGKGVTHCKQGRTGVGDKFLVWQPCGLTAPESALTEKAFPRVKTNACKLNRLGREDFLLGGSILITGSL
jgi:hypothetical protein